MSDDQRLNVPPELLHLIEKRELENRREDQRRSGTDQRQRDLGPSGEADSADDADSLVVEDQRSGEDRRNKPERRQTTRRNDDDQHASGQ